MKTFFLTCLIAMTGASATRILSLQNEDQSAFEVQTTAPGNPLCGVKMRASDRCGIFGWDAYVCTVGTATQQMKCLACSNIDLPDYDLEKKECDHIIDFQLFITALTKSLFCETMAKIRATAKSNKLQSDDKYLKGIKTYANEDGSVRYIDELAHDTKSAIVNQGVKGTTTHIKRPGQERITLLDLYLQGVFLPAGTVIAAKLDELAAEALTAMVNDITDTVEKAAAQTILDDGKWLKKTSVTDLYKKALLVFDKSIKEWAPPKLDL